MADNLILKIRSKRGCMVLDQLAPDATASIFLRHVSQMTGIPFNRIKVLTGFPRKPIQLYNCNDTLKDLGFASGDMLIIEENEDQHAVGIPGLNITRQGDFRVVFSLDDLEFVQCFIPGNNSCLFASIQFAITGGQTSHDYDMLYASRNLRRTVADYIRDHSDVYNDAILGMPNFGYQEWITNEDNWGGAIELSVLSNVFDIEIVLINTSTQHLNFFGENSGHMQRIFLIYNGVHYDGFAKRSRILDKPLMTLFSSEDDLVTNVAHTVAKNYKGQFEMNNGQSPSYICSHCDCLFHRYQDLISHAQDTRHHKFQQR